jgi:hypothetical protein
MHRYDIESFFRQWQRQELSAQYVVARLAEAAAQRGVRLMSGDGPEPKFAQMRQHAAFSTAEIEDSQAPIRVDPAKVAPFAMPAGKAAGQRRIQPAVEEHRRPGIRQIKA